MGAGIAAIGLWLVASAGDDGAWWPWVALAGNAPGGVIAALAAGGLFAMGSLLLLTAAETVGLGVAASVSGTSALSVAVVLGQLMAPVGRSLLVASSLALALTAVVVSAMATVRRQRSADAQWEKPVVVAVLSGAILASFPPLFARASTGAAALSPLAATQYLAAGTSLCGMAVSRYLMVRPIHGAPLNRRTLLATSTRQHFRGVLGGLMWCAGMGASLTASPAAGALASYGVSLTTPLITSMWGVIGWREFPEAQRSGLGYLCLALALHLLSTLALVSAYRATS